MILINKDQTLINFTHIPRTAGRFVMSSLYQSGYRDTYSYSLIIKGKEILHQTHNVIKTFSKQLFPDRLEELNNAPKFTIVRNPIDKFISASNNIKLLCKINNINPKKLELENYDKFFETMEERPFHYNYINEKTNTAFPYIALGLRDSFQNFFEPQINFIDDRINIWKFEEGFNDEFESWVIEEVGIKDFRLFEVDQSVTQNTSIDNDKLNSKYFTDKVKENIARYYKEDMIKFQYE